MSEINLHFLAIQMLCAQVTNTNIKETNFLGTLLVKSLKDDSYPFSFTRCHLSLSKFLAHFIVSALTPTFFHLIEEKMGFLRKDSK